MTEETRCEPPPEWREQIARAIHEGLGKGWAYSNWGGDEWNSCRFMLDDAADKVMAIVTPPAVVAALVEALEGIRGNFGGTVAVTADDPRAVAIRAALAAYREAGR